MYNIDMRDKRNAYYKQTDNKIRKYHLNKVRRLKKEIDRLTLDIQAEKDVYSVNVSKINDINVKVSKIYNQTLFDKTEELEQKKKALTKVFHSKQKELAEKITHRKQGTITNLMLDYFVNCKPLEEMEGIYNISASTINNILDKYSLRLELDYITLSTYDKNIIDYAKDVELATNIREFLFKGQYTLKEYELIIDYLKDKEEIYIDLLLNYLIRFEFDINMICKIYKININDLVIYLRKMINELKKYLKDNNYFKR